MWIRGVSLKSEGDVASIFRHICVAKHPIPYAESQSVVNTFAPMRLFLRMVPDVHLRRIEDVFQRANRQSNVRMV